MSFKDVLEDMRACGDSRRWVGHMNFDDAWEGCLQADWLMWFAVRSGVLTAREVAAVLLDVLRIERDPSDLSAEGVAQVRRIFHWLDGERACGLSGGSAPPWGGPRREKLVLRVANFIDDATERAGAVMSKNTADAACVMVRSADVSPAFLRAAISRAAPRAEAFLKVVFAPDGCRATLRRLEACSAGLSWVAGDARESRAEGRPLWSAWDLCPRAEHLVWLAARVDVDRRLVGLAICELAELARRTLGRAEALGGAGDAQLLVGRTKTALEAGDWLGFQEAAESAERSAEDDWEALPAAARAVRVAVARLVNLIPSALDGVRLKDYADMMHNAVVRLCEDAQVNGYDAAQAVRRVVTWPAVMSAASRLSLDADERVKALSGTPLWP